MEVGNPIEKPAEDTTAHVLIFPFPLQGHVSCMLKLAELLSKAGLHVTFLNTDYNRHRLSRYSTAYALLAQGPRFRFESIPDGLADEDPRSAFHLMDLEESLRTRSAVLYRELLINNPGGRGDGKWPPVTCVIADGIMTFAVDIAEELGIPAIAFRTVSACSFWAYFCIPKLLQSGELPFPDEADLDEPVRSVPGMEAFLRRRDLPSFCRQSREHGADRTFEFVSAVTANTSRARALILNTIESLEAAALSHIRAHFPLTYAVGPLTALLRPYEAPSTSDPAVIPTPSLSASLWQEDRTCITWLDSQPHGSVVYVSFGSLTVVSREEFHEFWVGLVRSGQRFLWVVRPDLVEEGRWREEMQALPEEVKVGTEERGCLVGWVPQEEVLAHPAVGCFLTHSGWNSTLDGVVAGVPMLCWPFFADQQINSRFVSEVWRLGLDMKDLCDRSVVEKMVREVMEGGRAEEWRRSAGDMARMARESVAEGGSSRTDFRRLIQYVKSLGSPSVERRKGDRRHSAIGSLPPPSPCRRS